MRRVVFLSILFFAVWGCATSPTQTGGTKTQTQGPPEAFFYPQLPSEPRLQFLLGIISEDDIGKEQKTTFDQFLLGAVQSGKQISRPWDIASSRGKIYMVERDLGKVVFADLDKREFGWIEDKRMGRLVNPIGIWVTPDDVKYVVDGGRKQVVVFGSDDVYLRAYGSPELFDKPMDVVVFGNSIYVVDFNKHQLFVLDKDSGEVVKTIGTGGSKEGQFYKPTHVVVDDKGNIFVSDAFNFRVQQFDPDGEFVMAYGSLGDSAGNFARPKGIAVSNEGHLFVADAAFGNVQIFEKDTAQLLLFFGGRGSGPGTMNFPTGLHVDYENMDYFQQYVDREFQLEYLLYCGNFGGDKRLLVFGVGKWIGPPISGK